MSNLKLKALKNFLIYKGCVYESEIMKEFLKSDNQKEWINIGAMLRELQYKGKISTMHSEQGERLWFTKRELQ